MNDLTNKFLIATPSINDPIFKKAIILLCDYNSEGAMGLIINKPINDKIDDFVTFNSSIEKIKENNKIYLGGPVDLSTTFVLHENSYNSKNTLKISKDLSLTSNQEIFKSINSKNGPSNFLLTFGYTGWDKNQLDQEIKNGDWLVAPSNLDLIFKQQDEKKWDISSNCLGFNIEELSGQTGLS